MSVSDFARATAAAPADAPSSPRREGGSTSPLARPGALALAAVLALSAAGAVFRLIVAGQPLFADELSTYWISAQHSLHGVLSLMYGTGTIKHAEITPPLYFLAAWATTQLGHAPMLLRLPSLVAGILTVPAVYLLARRAAGRRAALVACAFTAFSPFMIYYATEARAYGVMMLMIVGATLAMLLALDTGRARWWALYAVCSCAAFYSHYTCAFVLAAQLLWLIAFHPVARRPALLANLGAAAGVLPWLPGLINDYRSPTTKILSALSPFNGHWIWVNLGHWALGYPYAKLARLSQIPGHAALVLIAAGGALALSGLATRAVRWRAGPGVRWRGGAARLRALVETRTGLIVLLALATPVCDAVVSAISTHIWGIRNLAASWPALAIAFAALLVSGGRRLAPVATALALAGFVLAGVVMVTDQRHQRPQYAKAAAFVDRTARPGDVVVDETGELSPGPLTALDVTLHRHLAVVRALAPEEREHPFTLLDPYVSLSAATSRAVALAAGARIFVVGGRRLAAAGASGYRRSALEEYGGMPVALFSRAP